MNSRIPVCALGIIAVVLITNEVVNLWYFTGRGKISLECFKKIEYGMTEAEVNAILGGPPRWEVEAIRGSEEAIFRAFSRNRGSEWWGANGVIRICYLRGVVNMKHFSRLPFEAKPATLIETVLPWTRKTRYFQTEIAGLKPRTPE